LASTHPAPEESAILHELRVHQIELELQNEELRRTQAELEASWSRYFDLYDLAPVGYFTLSKKGMILEANLTAATLLGVARGALVQQPLSRYILPEDQDIYYRHHTHLLASGAPQVCELRLASGDGSPFWARVESTVTQDADGAPMSLSVVSDITVRKQSEERTAIQLRRLSALHRIDTIIAGTVDLHVALDVVVEQLTDNLGMDAARVLLLDPVTLRLDCVAGRGFRTPLALKAGFRLGERLAGHAALEQCTLQALDPAQFQENPGFAALWAGEGFAAGYGVPLICKGTVRGVLEVFHRRPHAIDIEWREFLETLAKQTAFAVDMIRIVQDL
jgi:PAS domain S-box-containing protein